MISSIVKKLFKKSDNKPKGNIAFALTVREKSKKLLGFASKSFDSIQDELISIKEKLNNLQETNYNLGLKHLENGRLTDAIFRFRFIKKFWPDMYDAYYQLSYCLTLNNKLEKAQKVLEELLAKKPDFDPKAHELLEHINKSIKLSTDA